MVVLAISRKYLECVWKVSKKCLCSWIFWDPFFCLNYVFQNFFLVLLFLFEFYIWMLHQILSGKYPDSIQNLFYLIIFDISQHIFLKCLWTKNHLWPRFVLNQNFSLTQFSQDFKQTPHKVIWNQKAMVMEKTSTAINCQKEICWGEIELSIMMIFVIGYNGTVSFFQPTFVMVTTFLLKTCCSWSHFC